MHGGVRAAGRIPRGPRPQSAPTGQRVGGAPRSLAWGLRAAGSLSAAVTFPSGVWNAVGLRQGDREGRLQARLTSARRLAPWMQDLTRESEQFAPPLPRFGGWRESPPPCRPLAASDTVSRHFRIGLRTPPTSPSR